jgi:hypothetical protein
MDVLYSDEKCKDNLFPKLKCEKITDKGCKYLSESKYLKHLQLDGCFNLSPEAFKYITKPKTLTHLKIDGCLVSDKKCEKLSESRTITYLEFHISDITDQALKYISKSLRSLMYLTLNICDSITDEGFEYLIKYNKSLTSIEISCCDNISEQCLSLLRKSKTLSHVCVCKCIEIKNGFLVPGFNIENKNRLSSRIKKIVKKKFFY